MNTLGYRIVFRFSGGLEVEGVLEDNKELEKLLARSPFTSVVSLWGEEVYFPLPIKMELKGERTVMSIGEIAYWPEGNCLCIFFGKTPMSKNDRPVAYSNVKPIGRIVKGIEDLKRVEPSSRIEVIINKL
ncbi:MAG: cyclophilin-like fold protein [Nitrososphaerota archaeon]